MKILFLTINRMVDISGRGLYTDLIRKLRDEGHHVYVVTPAERRYVQSTSVQESAGVTILWVRTLNIQKTRSRVEKGLATLLIGNQYRYAIKKYLGNIVFDLILYSTPPIMFSHTVRWLKNRYNATTYLLLKDIFPQNAVDLGMIRRRGILHWYFRYKEQQLYAVSDYIGCMSQANVAYLLQHNPQIEPGLVHVNPNSIHPVEMRLSVKEQRQIRQQYGFPPEVTVFAYGGNLGKPQGLDNLLQVINANAQKADRGFIIVGSGTEFGAIQNWLAWHRPPRVKLLEWLPREAFERLLAACDVGMIFLDGRFTIPNFPSRLLSYLECRLPVIAVTDPNTDLGTIVEENGFGLWAQSGDLSTINQHIHEMCTNPQQRVDMGKKGHQYLVNHYTVDVSYRILMQKLAN